MQHEMPASHNNSTTPAKQMTVYFIIRTVSLLSVCQTLTKRGFIASNADVLLAFYKTLFLRLYRCDSSSHRLTRLNTMFCQQFSALTFKVVFNKGIIDTGKTVAQDVEKAQKGPNET